MTNPLLRYVLFLSRRASTGSVTSEAKSVTSRGSTIFSPDSKISGGIIGRVRLKKKVYRTEPKFYADTRICYTE